MDTEFQAPQTFFGTWFPLGVLCLAIFITALDSTLLNVALPTMVIDFHTTIKNLQWVISAYSLVLAAFTITGGRLGDFLGRKNTFVIGAVLFAIGSLVASYSHSVGVLILGESIVEGFGAALMVPATSALIMANYTGRARAMAFGVWAGFASIAVAVGPILGGFFTTNYTWRYGFRINVFVVIILLIGAFFMKNSKDTKEKPELDIGGVFLSAIGLFLVVFGIIESSEFGWWKAKETFAIAGHALVFAGNLSVVVFSFVWGFAFLLAFMLWEIRREKHNHTPLISFGIFKNSQFSSGLLISFLMYLGLGGVTFSLPIFFQAVKNLSAFDIGLSLLPYSVTILVGSQLSSYLSKYIAPKYLIQIGLFFSIIGLVLLRQELTLSTTMRTIILGLSTNGFGLGLVASQFTNITLSAVSVEEAGEASGIYNTIRQLGLSFAIAISGSILIAGISTNIVKNINVSQAISNTEKPAVVSIVNSQASEIEFGGSAARTEAFKDFSPNTTQTIESITEQAIVDAARYALIFNALLIFIAFLSSFFLTNEKDLEIDPSNAVVH